MVLRTWKTWRLLWSRKPDAVCSLMMFLGVAAWCHRSTFCHWDEERGRVVLSVSVLRGGDGILVHSMEWSDAGNDPAHVENMALALE